MKLPERLAEALIPLGVEARLEDGKHLFFRGGKQLKPVWSTEAATSLRASHGVQAEEELIGIVLTEIEMAIENEPWEKPDVPKRLAEVAQHLKNAVASAYSIGFQLAMSGDRRPFDESDIRKAVNEAFAGRDISWGDAQSTDELVKFIGAQIWWGMFEGNK
jgi:hypothetical protein